MNASTDWVSAVAILAAGLILGLLFVVFTNKRRAAKTLGAERDLAIKDLHAKRDALIQQLRDPGLSPDERQRLELETAEVLRALDQSPLPAPRGEGQGEGPSLSPSTMNPTIKGFLWGAGSCAALAALFFFVMQSSKPREEGGTVTGGFESGAQQQQQAAPAVDPVLQQMEAAIQRDPNNLQLRNDLAQALLERDNLMGVFEQTKFVLDKSPDDTRALTYQALVRVAMGERDTAMQMLQRATKNDAKNLDAWVAMAWVYAQENKLADAEKMIAEAARQSPENKARLEEVFRQMKQQAQSPQVAGGNELPAGHPPVDGAPAPAAAAAGPSVRVTLDLDSSAKSKAGVLFVMARNPAGGPPVAVKRLQVTRFPVTFDLGSADSMLGQPLPAKFRLEARLDSDGDAATKLPTDPTAMQADVVPGAEVRLALK